MSAVIIPNTTTVEIVYVERWGDGTQHVGHLPIVGWVVRPDGPDDAQPVTTDMIPDRHAFHDRATGLAWVPDAQAGELHQTLAYLGWGDEGGQHGGS
jgi:hypothetical protein